MPTVVFCLGVLVRDASPFNHLADIRRTSHCLPLLLPPPYIVPQRHLYPLLCQTFRQIRRLSHPRKSSRAVNRKRLRQCLRQHLTSRPSKSEKLKGESELSLLTNAEVGENEEARTGAVEVASYVGAGYEAAFEHARGGVRGVVGVDKDRFGVRVGERILFAKGDLEDEVGAVLGAAVREVEG